MADIPDLERRLMLASGLSAAAIAAGAPALAALRPTPRQARGPFYPTRFPLDSDNDLVRVKGAASRARGEVTYLSGRVLDSGGRPLPGARIEIWQCDANGIYNHPGRRRPHRLRSEFPGLWAHVIGSRWGISIPDDQAGALFGPRTTHPLRRPRGRFRRVGRPAVHCRPSEQFGRFPVPERRPGHLCRVPARTGAGDGRAQGQVRCRSCRLGQRRKGRPLKDRPLNRSTFDRLRQRGRGCRCSPGAASEYRS